MKKFLIHLFTRKWNLSIQYKACLAATGAIRGTSKDKHYEELDLESSK